MISSNREKQGTKGEGKVLDIEAKGDHMQKEGHVYLNPGEDRDLSCYIRDSLSRLDMMIFLDRKEEAQAEIQVISEELWKMGL